MSQRIERNAAPPLEWLRVFDAAARLGNFTAAAAELGLTQAAASQRIRNLEAHLGAALFRRLPRGVELTVEGEAYAPHVRAALATLERSTSDLFSTPRRQISVAASASVVELWFAPRLPRLLAAFPQLQISFATIHRAAEFADTEADFEVRFGSGSWPGREARRLFDEELAPALAPGLQRSPSSDWRRLPQIAVSGPRDGWLEWAAGVGVAPPAPPSLRFDTFAQALRAARAGAGVLLGSLALMDRELEEGSLVRLPEPSYRMESGYWLTWPSAAPVDKEGAALLQGFCSRP